MQLGFHMNDIAGFLAGIECPAVEPAHMKGALGAVEVASDVVFFGIIAPVLSMLPDRRKVFKLKTRNLGIRSRRTVISNMTGRYRVYGFRISLFRPP